MDIDINIYVQYTYTHLYWLFCHFLRAGKFKYTLNNFLNIVEFKLFKAYTNNWIIPAIMDL